MLEHFSLLFELLMYGTVSQLTTLTSHHFVLLNEHLKFQKFSGGDTTGPHSHCGSWRLAASCRTHPISPVSAVRGESAPGAGTQNVMLWVVSEVATILWAELEPEVAENTVSYDELTGDE